MALLPYERELVDFWLWLKPRSVRLLPRTGIWIKKRLEYLDEDYCYRAWKEHERFLRDARAVGVQGLRHSTYDNFRIYWGYLSSLGLIIPVRTEPSRMWKPRVYYSLTPGIPDGRWNDVYQKPRPPRV